MNFRTQVNILIIYKIINYFYTSAVYTFFRLDDFEETEIVGGIINRLDDKDNEFMNSENNGQRNLNEYVYDESHTTYTIL